MASEYLPPEGGSPPLSEHAVRTRETWNDDAPNWIEGGRRKWASPTPLWGAWDIPEAYRLLRPGGRLILLADSVLAALCYPPSEEPAGETLVRPQLGLHRIDWPEGEIDFRLPHGEMFALLRRTGFEMEALRELYAPEGPDDEVRFYMRRGWARRWPAEDLWVARRPPA
jgi:hypothetical protein